MSNLTPGVFIKQNKSVNNVLEQDFATLFVTFGDKNFPKNLFSLDSFAQTLEYPFLKSYDFLYKAVDLFFANKGKKLCILNYPIAKNGTFNLLDFESFLSRNGDRLVDVDLLLAVDLYNDEIYKERISQKTVVSIQRCINEYAKKSNRLSITDIFEDFNYDYLDVLGESVIYYPWIREKSSFLLPPSICASALFSQFANDSKLATSVANKDILNVVDVEKNLEQSQKEHLIKNRINPVVLVPHQGVRIWGVKTFDSNVDTVVELRVLKYIKRNLHKIAKVYIFELNTKSLADKLVMQIDNFLFRLWEKGILAGRSREEAFLVSYELDDIQQDESLLSIKVAVALVKPVEFIFIELNKVAQDGTQSTLSIN